MNAGFMPSLGQQEGRALPTLPTVGPRPPATSMPWFFIRKAVMSFQSYPSGTLTVVMVGSLAF